MASDWTTGAAKWAAVFFLGAASTMGIAWSLWGNPAPSTQITTVAAPVLPQAVAARQAIAATLEPVASTETAEPPVIEALELPEPEASPAAEVRPPAPAAPSPVRTININTASAAELELLPGIGPAMAARIVEHRAMIGRFRSVDQLDDVKGIGPKTLAKLRPLVRVE